MTTITFLSTAALILGLAGILPQITTMLRNRSAAGQSAAAWVMGMTVNGMMGYVNVVGYNAELLAWGNLFGGAFCALALACVVSLQRGIGRTARPPAVTPSVAELDTHEFIALKQAVLELDAQRAGERPKLELVAA